MRTIRISPASFTLVYSALEFASNFKANHAEYFRVFDLTRHYTRRMPASHRQTAARPKYGRPLQSPLPPRQDGFVAAVPFTENVLGEPSRALRDGTGTFVV